MLPLDLQMKKTYLLLKAKLSSPADLDTVPQEILQVGLGPLDQLEKMILFWVGLMINFDIVDVEK